jgi:hypothetical protein
MKKLSGFDLGIIIAFVVITLLGGGACYYLSGQLDAAKDDVTSAEGDFSKYSKQQVFLPTQANEKVLQANLALIQAQLDPLVHGKLQPDKNPLSVIVKMDPVSWKAELDQQVHTLNAAAKTHGIVVPPNFYYGFSRYLNPTPGEDQTVVLTKQLRAIEEISNILINAPVKAIAGIRRTYDEDAAAATTSSANTGKADLDFLPGHAVEAPSDVYTAFPFEVNFDSTTIGLRKIFNDLTNSPYIFVVRTITIQNTRTDSPQLSDLDKMAGPPTGSVGDSAPGEVAATRSAKGPQFLFGNEYLHVHLRLDLIEWHGASTAPAPDSKTPAHHARPGATGDRT